MLKWPWQRYELILSLDELIDPARTALWLKPDPKGHIIGIEEVFHFFFDDHDFDESAIGYLLLELDEVLILRPLHEALTAIHETDRDADSDYFLNHDLWPKVVDAARAAHTLIVSRGVPRSD